MTQAASSCLPRRGRRLGAKKVEGEPADRALGRGRGGFGGKVHLATDGNGVPLAALVTGGQRNECAQAEALVDAVRVPPPGGRPRRRPAAAGDKGYSYPHVRRMLRARGIRAVIPYRRDQRPDDRRHNFDRELYRRRSAVERCVGWLKENRAVGTRFDKLAVNYLAGVHLAFVRRYLKLLTR